MQVSNWACACACVRAASYTYVRKRSLPNHTWRGSYIVSAAMEEFVSSSLSLLYLEREAELSRGEAIIAAQLQQPKLLESKGTGLLRLKVIFALSLIESAIKYQPQHIIRHLYLRNRRSYDHHSCADWYL